MASPPPFVDPNDLALRILASRGTSAYVAAIAAPGGWTEAPAHDEGPSDNDLALARAMLGRASRALEKEGGDEASRARVRDAAAALAAAIEGRDAGLMDRTDALSDALLDLI